MSTAAGIQVIAVEPDFQCNFRLITRNIFAKRQRNEAIKSLWENRLEQRSHVGPRPERSFRLSMGTFRPTRGGRLFAAHCRLQALYQD